MWLMFCNWKLWGFFLKEVIKKRGFNYSTSSKPEIFRRLKNKMFTLPATKPKEISRSGITAKILPRGSGRDTFPSRCMNYERHGYSGYQHKTFAVAAPRKTLAMFGRYTGPVPKHSLIPISGTRCSRLPFLLPTTTYSPLFNFFPM